MARRAMYCFYCGQPLDSRFSVPEHQGGGRYFFICSACNRRWTDNEIVKVCPHCKKAGVMLDHEVAPCTEDELYWEEHYDS
jgi:predicted amidophosphoribosyltransferase